MTPKPITLRPSTPRARRLRSVFEALAAVGVGGERVNAQKKLDRLLKRYDFKAPTVEIGDMFAGTFKPSPVSRWLASFSHSDQDIAAAVKWAIEQATGLHGSFRGDTVHIEADNSCVPQLASIATRITDGFKTLWGRLSKAPGITERDRSLFFRGLWDGMMQDARTPGERLPERRVEKVRGGRVKKNALAAAPGLGIHPYSVALDLGRQLRFETPITDIVGALEEKIGERKVLPEVAA